ncbi:hypothetical protein ACJRO7_005450 [Eucalyptus globulus]|uniref:Uncharacterized protein n=1 Tax=Eucalyptus globulus TaxID=34317 RepID=A0ABD3IZY7_EUCGL
MQEQHPPAPGTSNSVLSDADGNPTKLESFSPDLPANLRNSGTCGAPGVRDSRSVPPTDQISRVRALSGLPGAGESPNRAVSSGSVSSRRCVYTRRRSRQGKRTMKYE